MVYCNRFYFVFYSINLITESLPSLLLIHLSIYLFILLIYFTVLFSTTFFSILFYSIATQDTSRNASFLVVQLSMLMTRVRALSVEFRQWQTRCPECKYLVSICFHLRYTHTNFCEVSFN